jgi:hypothetical protein
MARDHGGSALGRLSAVSGQLSAVSPAKLIADRRKLG